MTNTYEAPVLTVVGSVEGLTAFTNVGSFYDHTVMIGDPIEPDQKKTPGLGLS